MDAKRFAAVLLAVVLVAPLRADEPPAPTITWTGAASLLWNNPANWNPGRVPLATDHVSITGSSNFTVTLNVSASIASLALGSDSGSVTQTLAFNNNINLTCATNSLVRSRGVIVLPNGDGPSISGAGLMEYRGVLDWTGGRLYGRTLISPEGRVLLRGGNYMRLTSGLDSNPAVFTNMGTVTWLGGDRLYAYNNSQIHNIGRWELAVDGLGFDHCCAGAGATFVNSGTLIKTGGTNTSSMNSVYLINNGTVAADMGILQFSSGVASTWNDGGQIAGAGRVLLNSGNATLNGKTTLRAPWEWTADGLNILGNGSVGGPAALDWTAGTVMGALTVATNGRVNLRGGAYMRLTSAVNTNPAIFTNLGLVVFSGGNRFVAYYGAQVHNYGEWRMDADGLAFEHCCGGNWPTFHNYGLLTKTGGTNESTFDSSLTINYPSGTISANTGTLRFNSSTEWRDGGRIAGAGNVLQASGTADLRGNTILNGAWQWGGANVTGTGSISGPVALTWRTARLFGNLTINPGANLEFSGEYYPSLNSGGAANPAILTNRGTVTWVGGNSLYGAQAAQIYNYHLWRLTADGTGLDATCCGPGPTFHNYGTLAKTAGTNETLFTSSHTINYSNATVQSSSGTLRFNSSSEWRGGGQITGAGRVLLNNGSAAINGTTTLFGSWQWAGVNVSGTGAISGTIPLVWRHGRLYGNLTINPGSSLEFTGEYYPLLDSGSAANPAILTNRGTVTWIGGNPLYSAHAGQIYNYNQWRLTADGTALAETCCGGGPTFHNYGTLAKTGGTNEVIFTSSHTINNSNATVQSSSGTLNFNTSSEWRDGGQIAGTGRVLLQNGNAQIKGTTTLNGSWQWAGVAVRGTGAISGPVSGSAQALVWRYGRLYGNLTINPGSSLEFTGEYYPVLDSGSDANPAILTNRGTVSWPGGSSVNGAHSGQIHNYGQWQVTGEATALDTVCCGGSPTFHNHGHFRKTGANNTTMAAVGFVNNGRITTEAGQLTFNVTPSNPGEFHFPLRGNVAGSDFGSIRVPNNYLIRGTLRAEPTNGYAPLSGQYFDLVTAGGGFRGAFNPVLLPALPPDLGWTVDYYPTVTRLRVTDACLADGLVSWWPGDGGAGDVTGLYNGALVNGASFTTGLVNQAFSFDGVDDYVNLGNWNPGTRWTLQAWVKLRQIQAGRRAILGTMNNNLDWALASYNGAFGLNYRAPSSNGVMTNNVIAQTNTWYHLAGTFDGSNVALYVNGILIGTAAGSPDYNGGTGGARIGGSSCCGDYFAGAVDEATVHNRALTQGEILNGYNQGAAGRCAGLGLTVLSFTPGGLVTSNVSRFVVRFNQPFNTNTFTTADMAVTGPAGAISTSGFSVAPDPSFDGRTFIVTLPPLTQEGGYTINIGPNVETVSGQNMTGGVFTTTFTIDKSGPRVIAFTPNSTISNQVTALQATFSETISAASVQTSDVTITGANAPSVVSFTQLASNIFRFNLNRSLTQGSNSIVVGPNITDLAGNQMDQNNNGTPGEATVDAYAISLQVETPDLTVAALNAPAVALAGQPANLIYTITNAGTAPALGGWRAEFRLATDGTGTNSSFLGNAQITNTIAAGASLTRTQTLVMPQGLAGIRHLGVRLDSLDQVLEQNETNNIAWSQTGTAISAPDLVVSNLVANSSALLGSTVTARWERVNIGTAATVVPGEDRVFLSLSSTSIVGAHLLAVVPGAVLNTGESLSRTQSLAIPLETTLPAGNYFIVIAVDSPDAQPESNEGNNRAASAVTLTQPPLPDLAVAEFVPPTKLFPGAHMDFNWTVTNQGSLGVTNTAWRERVSFSNSVVGLVTLADLNVTNTLVAGGSISRTQQILFPGEFPTDPGFLIITLDYFDDVIELTEANNIVRSDSVVPVAFSLQLTISPSSLIEGTNTIVATVHRNGANTEALTVSLSNNLPARLTVTNEVTIAAGAESTSFLIGAPDNGFIDGIVFAHLGASASNYLSALTIFQLVDESRRTLTLTLETNQILEGLTVAATVSRGIVETQDLVVFIGTLDPLSVAVPFSVTIPAGAASVPFAVLATDDFLFNGWRTNTVRAGAIGLDEARAELVVRDDDLPAVTLELSPQAVPENGGSQAGNLTARLSAPASRNVVLDLVSSDPSRARVPVQVSVPAGQVAASVPVSVIDNLQLGSNAPVQFQGLIHESGGTRTLAVTPIVFLQILDDESPALRVTLDKDLVSEGLSPAANGTVSRTGSTASSLLVQLGSSDTTEVTVPVSVTIPAGASSAPFAVASLQDGTTDGAQKATITATAAGYTPGSADITVSDQDLPDLRVVSVFGPLTALAEDNFTMSYRVENQGRISATSNLVTKVYLRTDPLAFGGTVVGTYTLANELPPGQFFEQSLVGRFPRNLGTYYLVVQTDTDGRNNETLENNNTLVSAPIQVNAPWTATVQTPITSAVAGTPIPMTGTATRPGGAAVANTTVSIHVLVNGMKRTIGAITDSSGNFSATFTPFAKEAGNYTIAAGHPGVEFLAPQDSFSLFGMTVIPLSSDHHILEGQVARGVLAVKNLSSIPLTGLSASVVSQPPGWNTSLVLTNDALLGDGSNALHFIVTPNSSGIAPIVVRVSSAEGATVDAQLEVAVEPLLAKLVATPRSLFSGMVRGEQTIVKFDLQNVGGAATGPVAISLPAIPWLSLATPSPLPPLGPGESNIVTLILSPPTNLDLISYEGALLVNGQTHFINVPFTFRALSAAKGDLVVKVVDELTYYAEGAPLVTNATVTLRDAVSHNTITNANTGTNGTVTFPELPEGYYEVQVQADKHQSFKGNTYVAAGRTNEFEVFVSRSLVEYIWTVVPIEIEDRTRIVIETTFETVVPLPVITMEPAFIDLADLPDGESQIEIRISNHGLIAAHNVGIELPVGGGVTFESILSDLGTLPANSSVTIPVVIRQPIESGDLAAKSAAKAGSTRDRCYYYIRERHELVCGPKTNVYYTTTAIRDQKATGCSGSGGPSGSGGGGGYIFNGGPLGPYGAGAGGSSGVYYAPRVIAQKEKCGCEGFVPTCFEVGLGAAAGLAGSAVQALVEPIGGEADVSLTGSAKMCTCCDEEGEGVLLEAQAEVNGSIALPLPVAGKRMEFEFSEAGQSGTLEVGIGCEVVPKLEIKGAAVLKTDCHLKNRRVCASATIEAPIEFVCSVGGTATVGDAEQGVQAFATIKSGVSAEYTECDGQSSLKFCRKAVTFEAGFAFEIGGVSFTPKMTQELIPQASYCDQPAGAPQFSVESPDEAMFRQVMEAIVAQVEQQLGEQAKEEAAKRKLTYALRTASNTTATAKSSTGIAVPKAEGDGICARVKLRIEQDLVMARNAFDATLELINRDPATPLENIEVVVDVYDIEGNAVTERFGFRTPSVTGLGAVNGTGFLAANSSGRASFIMVPTSEAAPEGPTVYFVGGRLSYSLGGRSVSIPLTAAPITVYPDPRLSIKYFHQRDVYSDDPFTADTIEPTIPFTLGVMVKNAGKGEAKNVRIISGQPEIVENDRGLLIDFEIIATEVAGQNVSPSLTANFGTIPPGNISIGRWLLTSTLQGLFIDYKATFEHLDSLGKTNLSLVDEVTIHEMIRQVQANGPFEDHKPDFLVNDDYDPDDLPDHIYLSDGTTNLVSVVRIATHDGAPNSGDLSVSLTADMPAGWGYLRVPDPANGAFQLLRVVRSDGREIPVNTNAWVTDRTFIGRTERPVRENILHLLDHDSAGTYTLIYSPLPPQDFTTPATSVDALPPYSNAEIPVSWGGVDNGGGTIAFYDIYVAINRGPFLPWLQNVTEQGAIYSGLPGYRYEFYSIGTDNSNNREPAPIYADTETIVALSNNAPSLSLNSPTTIDEGTVLVITANATDPEFPGQSLLYTLNAGPAGATINPSTGRVQWNTGEGNGPSTNLFRVVARDNGLPPLYATSTVSVIVREVNQTPVLPTITDRNISEGFMLRITNSATDGDLPANTLSYKLAAGSPLGASIGTNTGVFQWQPTETQGGTTNSIAVIVTDNGSPALSATQRFNVIVRDTLGDFRLALGRTNLYRGATSSVPVRLTSGLELTNIQFAIEQPITALTNFSLLAVSPDIGSATLTPEGDNRSAVVLLPNAGVSLQGDQTLASLRFTTFSNGPSLILPLLIKDLSARKNDGTPVANPGSQDGRVIIVGAEPVLESFSPVGGAARVNFYGNIGVSYQIQSSPALYNLPWQTISNVTPATSLIELTLPRTSSNTFFRAVKP